MKIKTHIKKLYRKFLSRWTRIPRPLRILILLAGIVTAAFFTYLFQGDRKSTRLNSSHANESRMPSSA